MTPKLDSLKQRLLERGEKSVDQRNGILMIRG